MSDHHDADRRALARCEETYLREPAWRTGDLPESTDDVCHECGDEPHHGAPLCALCAAAIASDNLSDDHLRDLEARHLPDDPRACTAEHVRAESARCSRLRDAHGDDEAATSGERALAWYVLRAIAAEGHPLAVAATEVTT